MCITHIYVLDNSQQANMASSQYKYGHKSLSSASFVDILCLLAEVSKIHKHSK